MATLTLKNVPDQLHRRLKKKAAANRRSLNQEAILCLAANLPPARDAGAVLADLDAFRKTLPALNLTDEEINAAKSWGRP